MSHHPQLGDDESHGAGEDGEFVRSPPRDADARRSSDESESSSLQALSRRCAWLLSLARIFLVSSGLSVAACHRLMCSDGAQRRPSARGGPEEECPISGGAKASSSSPQRRPPPVHLLRSLLQQGPASRRRSRRSQQSMEGDGIVSNDGVSGASAGSVPTRQQLLQAVPAVALDHAALHGVSETKRVMTAEHVALRRGLARATRRVLADLPLALLFQQYKRFFHLF